MEHINLNNEWQYSPSFSKKMTAREYDSRGMEEIRLPHTNVITPFNYFDDQIYQFISCYRRNLPVKSEWKGKQVLLTFEGIAHVATVYVNGAKVTTHYGGYTAFTMDIGPYLRFPDTGDSYEWGNKADAGDLPEQDETKESYNVLVVEVDSRECNNLPPFGNVIDYMTYGGIYREAYLDIKENISIEDAFIIAGTDHEVRLQLTLHQYQSDRKLKAGLELKDASGKPVCNKIIDITGAVTEHHFTADGVLDWDLEHPYLYVMKLTLYMDTKPVTKQDTRIDTKIDTKLDIESDIEPDTKRKTEQDNYSVVILDERTVRFGFRTCEFKADGFYLNDKKIKIIGLNRHQSFPYVGYAMPKRLQQRDAEVLKWELQVNAVRTSHYPQSKHFINRCDELGLLVFTEIPGWQHIGDEEWKAVALENVRDMVIKYRNHPSIVLWGVRINESQDDDEFYRKTNKTAHDLDPSRQTGGVRYLKKSSLLEDVYTYNDFLHNGITKGLDRKEDVSSDPKAPYLVSEFNGHMYPTKTYDNEKRRLQHALRHATVLDAAFGQEGVSGAFGWCMFDYNTHKDFGSGDRICYHGVMDMFRNPKLAAAVYASQKEGTDVCEISSSLDIGDHPAGDIGDVFAFTNADSIRLYKNDSFVKEFYPDRNNFPSMPHPPVVIDDFVGDLLEKDEHYSHKKAETIKKLLFAVKKFGPNHLPLKHKLSMSFLMLTEHMKMEDAANLYYKYIGGWGGAVTTFRFEAIKDGKIVKTINKKPATRIGLVIQAGSRLLREEETYDATEIRIQAVDENGNLLPYYQEPVSLQVWGAVELIGPELISLKGGMAGTYVKTAGRKGEGGLRIYQKDLGETEIRFTVE